MIKKAIVFLAFAAIGIFLAVGVQAQTVRGEGRYMSNTLTHLNPFTSIDVRADVQVDIWQRSNPGVSVSGKANLVELANIYVEDETLIIDFKRPVRIKGEHALHVAIGMSKLESVAVRGKGRVRMRGPFETTQMAISAGDNAYVTAEELKADLLRVQATNKAEVDLEHIQVKTLDGALFNKAEMELSGSAQQAQMVNNGSKEIDGADLRVQQAHVQINGSGDVEVFAMGTLKAEALGGGKIIYHGHPVLTRAGSEKHILPAFED